MSYFRDTRTTDLLARGTAIAQEQADQQLLREFDRRVQANIKARTEKNPEYLRGLRVEV